MITILQELDNDIKIFRLSSETITVDVTNYGGHIISIVTPDKDGNMDDVVLGFDDINIYQTKISILVHSLVE